MEVETEIQVCLFLYILDMNNGGQGSFSMNFFISQICFAETLSRISFNAAFCLV